MNYTTKKQLKEVSSSREQSFHLIRDKESLLSQRDDTQDLGEKSGFASDNPPSFPSTERLEIIKKLIWIKARNGDEQGFKKALDELLKEFVALAGVDLETLPLYVKTRG